MERKTTDAEDEIIKGYFHSVSPIKTSRKNTRYFNATLQTSRDEYHQTVIFSPEKHQSIMSAERTKTPVKLKNARKVIGFTNQEDFDVQCSNATTIDVTTEIDFAYRPPKDTPELTIVKIKNMSSRQYVLKLIATVVAVESSSTMITVRETESEVRNCTVADLTGEVQLSLWDAQIDQVVAGKSYILTNLSTRSFNGKTTLTSTRNTTITEHSTTIALPTTARRDNDPIETHTVTQELEGATINIKKQCPKCRTTQSDFIIKERFHRCQMCKILRRQTSYITKYNGFLVVKVEDEELSLPITNSLLTNFLKNEDVSYLDSQDIEEFLLKSGPLSITYTNEHQIINVSKLCIPEQLTCTEMADIDAEQCEISDDVVLPSSSTLLMAKQAQPDS